MRRLRSIWRLILIAIILKYRRNDAWILCSAGDMIDYKRRLRWFQYTLHCDLIICNVYVTKIFLVTLPGAPKPSEMQLSLNLIETNRTVVPSVVPISNMELGFHGTHLLLPQSITPAKQRACLFLPLITAGDSFEDPSSLCICKDHLFGNSCFHHRKMLGLQSPYILWLALAPTQPFCGGTHSLFSTFPKCPEAQPDWKSLELSYC